MSLIGAKMTEIETGLETSKKPKKDCALKNNRRLYLGPRQHKQTVSSTISLKSPFRRSQVTSSQTCLRSLKFLLSCPRPTGHWQPPLSQALRTRYINDTYKFFTPSIPGCILNNLDKLPRFDVKAQRSDAVDARDREQSESRFICDKA